MITGPVETVQGASITLDAGPGYASYSWSPGGQSARTITVSPGATATYTVTVTNGQGCQVTSDPHTVTVKPYDLNFYDDHGRARLCVNSINGNWVYTVLQGTGAGNSYKGTGNITRMGNMLWLFYGLPGKTIRLTMIYSFNRATVFFTDLTTRVSSFLVDSNTTNNPPGCGP
jgi:hypothetical protein